VGRGTYEPVVTGTEAAAGMGTYDPLGVGSGLSSGLAAMMAGGGGNFGITNPGFDANAFMSQFMGNAGGLSGLVSGQLSPLEAALNARAATESEAAGRSIAGGFSNMGYGAGRSGAAAGAIGAGMAKPFADVQSALGQQQIGLTGNLWNNMMGLGAQQQGLGAQLGFQYGQANQQGAMQGVSNMLNAMGLGAGSMTGVGSQYEYQPSAGEQFLTYLNQFLGTGGAAAGGIGALIAAL